MLFHTWPFLFFFLVVYPVYLLVKGTRFRLPWLLVASYFFYACFHPFYIILILYLTVVDYIVVAKMERSRRKKAWLLVSIANGIGLLGFFKYSEFISDNVNLLLSNIAIPYRLTSPSIFLHVGLSFYVLQSLSYVIDFYRGRVERQKSFIAYATFLSYFPKLIAGPIERAKNLLPQLLTTARVTSKDISDGLSLFIVGLFKKVALADYLALYVDKIYDAPGQFQSPALILATFLFSWQIYLDFSGYTDMARGVARMMGIRLMLNFNNPYLATGLGEFWSRWHISLSSWFKDYLYIPLGGNRKGTFNTYRNMFLTMVISGLWHGAAWTFVVWAALHALGRFATRELERTTFYKNNVPKLAKQLFVFAFVTFAWIFFRADSIGDAWVVVSRIFGTGFTNPQCPIWAMVLILAVWSYQFVYESKVGWLLELRLVRVTTVILMILYLAVFASSGERAFIYLQF
jgi:alginate O-acetyltransferase complex protein AlgI